MDVPERWRLVVRALHVMHSTAADPSNSSRRQKEQDGKPKLQHKTPEQIIILERAFAEHPYISELETRDLVYELGSLSRKQIAAWFCQQRKTRATYEDYEERDWMNRDLMRNPEMSFKTHPISKSRKVSSRQVVCCCELISCAGF